MNINEVTEDAMGVKGEGSVIIKLCPHHDDLSGAVSMHGGAVRLRSVINGQSMKLLVVLIVGQDHRRCVYRPIKHHAGAINV